ncbi:MAG: GNAT family N-acetyltransferase [Planctomycetales bacterium]|nr:GNAT family N-acetyltransferase [Planctomycetales bacterium]
MDPRRVRICDSADVADLAGIMFEAVRHGPSLYTEEQRAAWVPERRSGPAWEQRLAGQFVYGVEDSGRLVGFMSLEPQGYIDFAYVHPAAQGTGAFRLLYQAIEARATELKLDRLWVHASLMARPAFASVGFAITEEQIVEVGGESLRRFEMEKRLEA